MHGLFSALCVFLLSSATALSMMAPKASSIPPPVVYTIAGSDSGGGAGIQADLKAIHGMGCHGCSAITCLTAQSSTGVTGVHSPPTDFLRLQLETLLKDLPPRAIKIGMLGSKELALEVGQFLKRLRSDEKNDDRENAYVVLDPVMISTSGHKLIEDETKEAIINNVFPYVDIVTPNKFETEDLLGRTLNSVEDIEKGAQDILDMGARSVLIKGGHSLAERKNEENIDLSNDVNATIGYAQDYFLSSDGPLTDGEERICDGCVGVWLRAKRYDSIHTHGTGCTLSSVIASALAIGHQQRSLVESGSGAARSIYIIDACCLAKAYVTAGVAQGVQLGQGPGPVVHTRFPSTYLHYPEVALDPATSTNENFLKLRSSFASTDDNNQNVPILGKLLPIVDSVEWLERLTKIDGITDVQIRIKGEKSEQEIDSIVRKCQTICQRDGVRLWVNDFWESALKVKANIHIGQEDLGKLAAKGGLEQIKKQNLALGISTHSYAELSAALGIKPSYISLGPVFGTQSKDVAFDPQGLATIQKWKELIDPEIPLVAIGGINDAERSAQVKNAGADCVAVIGAVKKDDTHRAVEELLVALENK